MAKGSNKFSLGEMVWVFDVRSGYLRVEGPFEITRIVMSKDCITGYSLSVPMGGSMYNGIDEDCLFRDGISALKAGMKELGSGSE